uniref:WAP domain-containing protein n=1 Tax=Anolis carolinensis TaxID=28377 RepID=L7MZN7_ANOCA
MTLEPRTLRQRRLETLLNYSSKDSIALSHAVKVESNSIHLTVWNECTLAQRLQGSSQLFWVTILKGSFTLLFPVSEKPGTCPKSPSKLMTICRISCGSDWECPEKTKCCSYGCHVQCPAEPKQQTISIPG